MWRVPGAGQPPPDTILTGTVNLDTPNPLPKAVGFQTLYWADQNKSSEAKKGVAILASGGKRWGGQKGVQQRIREGALSLEFKSSNSSPGSPLPDLPLLTWVISHDWASGVFASKQMKFLPSRFIVRAEPRVGWQHDKIAELEFSCVTLFDPHKSIWSVPLLSPFYNGDKLQVRHKSKSSPKVTQPANDRPRCWSQATWL